MYKAQHLCNKILHKNKVALKTYFYRFLEKKLHITDLQLLSDHSLKSYFIINIFIVLRRCLYLN